MARARYLVDTSVFSRLTSPWSRPCSPRWPPRDWSRSAPVAFELGSSGGNGADNAALIGPLASFPSVPTTQAAHERAVDLQAELASRGEHRALALVDALVAPLAETHGLVVLHYNSDLLIGALVDRLDRRRRFAISLRQDLPACRVTKARLSRSGRHRNGSNPPMGRPTGNCPRALTRRESHLGRPFPHQGK